MKKQFYALITRSYSDPNIAYGGSEDTRNQGDCLYCPGCKGTPISSLTWLPPINVKVSAKRKLAAMSYGGAFEYFMLSKRLIEGIQAAGLRGLYNIRRANLYFRKKLLENKYYYPDIVNINAFVDLSKIVSDWKKPMCDVCQIGANIKKAINGVVFLHPEKIEYDIFCTTPIGRQPFASQKFKDFADANNFTNLGFVKSEDYIPFWQRPSSST